MKRENSKVHQYDRGMLLIGDSMLRNFDATQTDYPIWLFSYPGLGAKNSLIFERVKILEPK